MPDITLPFVFVDGLVADADQVSENTYLPKAVPASLDVMNGRLSNTNRDGWSIDREDVRRGHFSQSKMVGATANLDYFDDTFRGVNRTIDPVDTQPTISGAWWDEAKAIAGCGISFYVPWTVKAVVFTWHITLIVDAGHTAANIKNSTSSGPRYSIAGGLVGGAAAPFYSEGAVGLILFINGLPIHPIQRIMLNGASTIAYDPAVNPPTYNNTYFAPDTRDWTGSFLFDATAGGQLGLINFPLVNFPIFEGWHTADIRIAFPPNAAPGDGVKQVRVKTRRMGYTLIR